MPYYSALSSARSYNGHFIPTHNRIASFVSTDEKAHPVKWVHAFLQQLEVIRELRHGVGFCKNDGNAHVELKLDGGDIILTFKTAKHEVVINLRKVNGFLKLSTDGEFDPRTGGEKLSAAGEFLYQRAHDRCADKPRVFLSADMSNALARLIHYRYGQSP